MTLKELKEVTSMVEKETIRFMRRGPANPEHLYRFAGHLTMKAYSMVYTPWKINQRIFSRLVSNMVFNVAEKNSKIY